MAIDFSFSREEMAVDEDLGYPIAYKKLSREKSSGLFDCGPPFNFIPSGLSQQEALRYKELDDMFPVLNLQAKPTKKTKIFVSLLWKQLNHLGNAGFDPDLFRIDPYGNVLYYHADSASPLAWDIDHWFPLSRGGLTAASNLRILQWQVCQKKHDQLEFLIPWWDLQLGISINQFLSIFASANSDFRHRAFSWLFSQGESEELNGYQTVDSHAFPQHFVESKEKIGLAPAGVVLSRRESYETSSVLRSLDINRKPRSSTPIVAVKKFMPSLKENEEPCSNPYQAIVLARDSLRQREETAKMEAEIKKLDAEVTDMRQKTEDEKLAIQELELVLIKRKRRAEKCRRLAETQSSYRAMLEKMIRDAMHQSVVYKEQVRLNQAAANALMARLEAQKAICDSSERELHKKHMQRDELEKQIRPEWENARKRSRMDDTLGQEEDDKTDSYFPRNEPDTYMKMKSIMHDSCMAGEDDRSILYLQGSKSKVRFHKELRKFLEEEQQRGAGASCSIKRNEEQEEHGQEDSQKDALVTGIIEPQEPKAGTIIAADENINEGKLHKYTGDTERILNLHFPAPKKTEIEEDDETRKQRGKGNVEKWLQMLLEAQQDPSLKPQDDNEEARTTDIVSSLDLLYPHEDVKLSNVQKPKDKESLDQVRDQQLILTKDTKKNEEIVELEAVRKSSYSSSQDGSKKSRASLDQVKDQKLILTRDAKRNEEIVELEPVRKSSYSSNQDGSKKSRATTPMRGRDIPMNNPPYKLTSWKSNLKVTESRKSNDANDQPEKVGKEKELTRSESARAFRRIPSSPSLILSGMKKRVDCIGKKPLVIGDDDDDGGNGRHTGENIFRSTIKSIKRAVKI